jgi:hypothetical protein
MNRKQFILLLVVAALIVSAGLIMYHRNNGSWQSAEDSIGRKLLPALAVNDIAQINIQSGTNVLHLARTDHLWRVQERAGYPADFSQISALLLKIADLKIIQNEEIGPSQLGRLELLPPNSATGAGTLVEFKDQNGQSLGSLLLGKKHMKPAAPNAGPNPMDGADGGSWPDGRYVMAGAGAKTVAVISDPLNSAQPQPEQWLDKDFLSIDRPRTISAQFAEATNSWQLTRASETNDWQLADAATNEKLDSSKISSLTTPFSSVSFNDVAPLADHANSNSASDNPVLTIETFDGLTYVAKIGTKQDDNYPVTFSITTNSTATPATADKLAKARPYEKWIYYLPSYNLDDLLKPRGQLLVQETNTVSTPSDK